MGLLGKITHMTMKIMVSPEYDYELQVNFDFVAKGINRFKWCIF